MNQIEKVKFLLKKMYLQYGNQILSFIREDVFQDYHEITSKEIEEQLVKDGYIEMFGDNEEPITTEDYNWDNCIYMQITEKILGI